MNVPKKMIAPESKASWDPPIPPDFHSKDPDLVSDASRHPESRPELSWLQEIGWHSRTRARDTGQVDPGQVDPGQVDHIDRSYHAAPMHRRDSLGDDAQRDGRLAAESARPQMPQQKPTRTKPSLQRGSVTPIAIGAFATLIGAICFIVAYDVASGGGFRKTLASTWPFASTLPSETVSQRQSLPAADPGKTANKETSTLVEKKPVVQEQQTLPAADSVQTANKETFTLIETKPVVLEQQTLPAAGPVQTATVGPPLKVVAPVVKTVDVAPAKPAEIVKASELVSAKAAPVPLPVAVAPPPEVKPELAVAAAPASIVPKPTAPTVIALASPPGLQKLSPAERDVFQDCENCPVMVVVQSGRFQMGPAGDSGASPPYELPVHQVEVAKAFAIGRFEITAGDWEQCVADKGCQSLTLNAGWNSPRQPAIQVSWNDISQQYLPWLSKVTGKSYRLPTEAEWEYAAKGGSAAGSSEAQDFGSLATTIAVGSRKPNSLGLYDMQGNVWEWVEDCWNDNYTVTPVDGSAAATGDCNLRIARGGSWASSDPNLLLTKRGWNKPTTKNNTLGFRVVRSL